MPNRNRITQFDDLRLDTADTAKVLIQSYADVAGEEALFRALLAERDLDWRKVRFWLGVYEQVSSKRHHLT